MTFSYTYEEGIRHGENQYDAYYDLDTQKIVEAHYVRSHASPGNPLIEALPPAISFRDIAKKYNHSIDISTPEELEEMDEYEREDEIDLRLDEFRVQLPFHAIIEKQFHSALIRSYSKRQFITDNDIDVKLNVCNKEEITHNKLVVKQMSNPVSGFTLLGNGGCGKSVGINMMLSHYPQTIIHAKGTFNRTYQIVYLLVQCTANSNFAQLYENIGDAIDRALGNFNPIYKLAFKSKTRLKDKYDYLKELVEKFSIGCLILDEIELMDTRSTKESSLEALLTLTNETGIALAVVGTMDAYRDLFFKDRTARRMGVSIIASRYCHNKQRFGYIAKMLTLYQWGNPITYTPELIDALYTASHGVISDLIEIYKLIQKDQARNLPYCDDDPLTVEKKKKKLAEFTITPEYIRKKATDYYELLSQARMHADDPTNLEDERYLADAINQLNSASETTEIAQLENHYDEVMKDPVYAKYIMLRENAVSMIMGLKKRYRKATIEKAFDMIMRNQSINTDPATVTGLVLAKLDQQAEERRTKKALNDVSEKKAVNLIEMQKSLQQNNADEHKKLPFDI